MAALASPLVALASALASALVLALADRGALASPSPFLGLRSAPTECCPLDLDRQATEQKRPLPYDPS